MSLELIFLLIVGVSVPLGALIFFDWHTRKQMRETEARLGGKFR
jgi:hypothetical protein